MYFNVMVDLETLGTSPDAPIVSIGAVLFNQDEVGETFYTHVSVEDAVNYGSVDGSTLRWWMQQSKEARSAWIAPREYVTTHDAINMFNTFLEKSGCPSNLRLWGCGAAFDNVILEVMYKKVGVSFPIKFWNQRCYRTIKTLFPDVPMNRGGTHHNALDDAVSQTKHLLSICKAHNIVLQ